MNAVTESKIRDISLVLAIVGLGIIYVSHSYIEPDRVDIEDIERSMIGDTVQVEAEVADYYESENAKFLDLRDSTGEIDAVDFEDREIPERGNFTGRVDVYEGDTQIIVEEVS